jgi:adenylate kinase
MAPSTELDYLKSLVAQLNNKIAALEAKAKSDVPPTPVQQLRTILIGPPGAGARREIIITRYSFV